jgi:hypothetical protein
MYIIHPIKEGQMKGSGLFAALGFFLFAQFVQADWTPAKRLTSNSGSSLVPDIAVDSSGNLHVVWTDDTPGNAEIYYRKSTNGGTSWTASQRLSYTPGYSSNPTIAIDSFGNPHAVWWDTTPGVSEIYYKKSTDGGTTWSPTRRLTWTSGWSYDPVIAVDSFGTLHLVWEDWTPMNPEIYYKKSSDSGDTWIPGKIITWTAGNCWSPDIAIDLSNNLHVVWEDNSVHFEIYYKKSMDAGVTWTKDKRITLTETGAFASAIAVGPSNNLHVVWEDESAGNPNIDEDYDLYYRKSKDGGAIWSTAKRLTWNSGGSNNPVIAADPSGNVHMVWSDDTPGNFEIYYKESTDGGTNWATSKRLTWNPGWSEYPAIAVDSSGNLHLVWADGTPGNAEIYYKKYVKQ